MRLGEQVKAVHDIVFPSGAKVPAGTFGHVQRIVARKGRRSQTAVAWIDPAGDGEKLLPIVEMCCVGEVEEA